MTAAEAPQQRVDLPNTSLVEDFDYILENKNTNPAFINAAVSHLETNLNQGKKIEPTEAEQLQQKMKNLQGGDREMITRVLNQLEAAKRSVANEKSNATESQKTGADVIDIERGKLIKEAKDLAEKILDVYDAFKDGLDSDNDYSRDEAFEKIAGLIHKLTEFTFKNNISIDSERKKDIEKIRLKLLEVQERTQQKQSAQAEKMAHIQTTERVEKPNIIKNLLNKIKNF